MKRSTLAAPGQGHIPHHTLSSSANANRPDSGEVILLEPMNLGLRLPSPPLVQRRKRPAVLTPSDVEFNLTPPMNDPGMLQARETLPRCTNDFPVICLAEQPQVPHVHDSRSLPQHRSAEVTAGTPAHVLLFDPI